MGWNSTLISRNRSPLCAEFQFPMGWNSTMPQFGHFIASLRFNSQWDGILRGCFGAKRNEKYRFNSQWDGILPSVRLIWCLLSKVSIPNGMEFYKSLGL